MPELPPRLTKGVGNHSDTIRLEPALLLAGLDAIHDPSRVGRTAALDQRRSMAWEAVHVLIPLP